MSITGNAFRNPMHRTLTLILFLLCLCAPAWAAFPVYEVTWNEPGESDPVPRSALAPEARPCFWTGTNVKVWADPPTDRQVQAVADLAVNGGRNPYVDLFNYIDFVHVPRGALVLIDAEGRSDESIRDTVTRYRGYAGRAPQFTVYALRYVLTDGAIEWLAANQFVWTRSFEARRAQIRDITDRIPILCVELYPSEAALDLQLRATDFIVANLRRIYPDKRIYFITRGDIFPTGFTWTNGMRTRLMTADERCKVVWFIRSHGDGVIAWGERKWNVEMTNELVRPVGWNATIR